MLVPRTTPLITGERICERVRELAVQIVDEYCGEEPFIAAGLLRGCYVFMADLMREISRLGGHVRELEFMVCSSYGSSTESSRTLEIQRDLNIDVRGERVLIVDDIVDTGHTLYAVKQMLLNRGADDLNTAVLLDKPSRREVAIDADFVGFTIENLFVVGYGLDYAQRYRELPHITVLEERPEPD
ncbi:MAG: Hypoxanthine phosphoribosyltransferase [Calditrichaeota bacterium]|nr:Hypoxanthine phosphoribosyltransferase [Calditrichota bacterium]